MWFRAWSEEGAWHPLLCRVIGVGTEPRVSNSKCFGRGLLQVAIPNSGMVAISIRLRLGSDPSAFPYTLGLDKVKHRYAASWHREVANDCPIVVFIEDTFVFLERANNGHRDICLGRPTVRKERNRDMQYTALQAWG
jgi:hypothetical protein